MAQRRKRSVREYDRNESDDEAEGGSPQKKAKTLALTLGADEAGGAPAEAKPPGALCDDYEERVRPMIDLIDRLRRIGLDKDVGLPTIVVVGDQSAGKSSVLQAISGVQLPRGSGIVTRCPLELRLKRGVDGEPWQASIQYKPDGQERVELELQGPQDVGMRVREAQDALAGEGKGVSTDLITLAVEAPGLPDLTLIDLPGIVRVVAKGQPESMAKKIKDLIQNYIKKDETIILAVVPANVDIETSEALQMASKVDPSHERTLGVITKADMVDRGAEDDLIAVLMNERIYLRKGYIAVKCRGQQAIKEKQSLAEALTEEEDFFSSAQHFSEINPEMYGIRSLSSRLTNELVEQVHRVLPDLKKDIFERRAKAREALANLGDGVPTTKPEQTRFLMHLLTTYTDDLKRLAEGREKAGSGNSLHNLARERYQDFAKIIRQRISHDFRQKVSDAMANDRGVELPRFIKYDTFKTLAASIISEFESPARDCLQYVAYEVTKRLGLLARERFQRFPVLETKVKICIEKSLETSSDGARKALDDLFTMEGQIFTQDEIFNQKLDDIMKQDEKESNGLFSFGKKMAVGLRPEIRNSKDKEVETMVTVLKAYMQIAVSRIGDLVPMVVMQHVIVQVTRALETDVMLLLEPDSGGLDALKEERITKNKRDMIIAQLTRLEEASEELMKNLQSSLGQTHDCPSDPS